MVVRTIKTPRRDVVRGKDGARGARGVDGKSIVGPAGKDGRDGKDGLSITGPPGRDGRDGKDGRSIAGPPGPQGEKGDMPAHRWSGTSLQFESPDGTWGESVDLKGDKGSQGDAAPSGATSVAVVADTTLAWLGL